jgi:lipopolysaccharide biosynthesis regulator YciM
MLVGEAQVRDLDRAEPILQFIFDNSTEYEPALCGFVDLYYKKQEYTKAMSVLRELQKRVKSSKEWSDIPALGTLEAKILRKL